MRLVCSLILLWTMNFVCKAFISTRMYHRIPSATWIRQQQCALSDGIKVYLNVPFEDKEEVKRNGGRWDAEAKKWYIGPDPGAVENLQRWIPATAAGSPGQNPAAIAAKRVFLEVPFEDRDEVKQLGARWDKEAKKWFVPFGASVSNFNRWAPKTTAKPPATQAAPNTQQTTKEVPAAQSAAPPKAAPAHTSSVPARTRAQDTVVFLDIETSGLPVTAGNVYPPAENLTAYDRARAVKVSATCCDLPSLKVRDSFSLILQPEGFTIDNAQFHGVTTERARKEGVQFKEVAAKLDAMLPLTAGQGNGNRSTVTCIVAHNAAFDLAILQSELHRRGYGPLLERLRAAGVLCTMELGKEVVGLKDVAGRPKKPTMRELYAYAMGDDLARSIGDLGVEQLKDTFQALMARGVVTVEQLKLSQQAKK